MCERETLFSPCLLQTQWRKLGWKTVLVAALGLPALSSAGEPDSDAYRKPEEQKSSWFGRMFGKSESPSGVKDTNGKDIPRADKIPSNKSGDANRQGAMSLEQQEKKANAVRMREEIKLFRRQEVCDQLKNIAVESNNDALWRQAEDLDRRAYAIYSQRAGKRIVNKASSNADEQVIDKHLGEGTGKRVSRPDNSTRANLGKDRNGRDSVGEEK